MDSAELGVESMFDDEVPPAEYSEPIEFEQMQVCNDTNNCVNRVALEAAGDTHHPSNASSANTDGFALAPVANNKEPMLTPMLPLPVINNEDEDSQVIFAGKLTPVPVPEGRNNTNEQPIPAATPPATSAGRTITNAAKPSFSASSGGSGGEYSVFMVMM